MDTQTILHILNATRTSQADLSINLDNQKVFSVREGRRPKIVTRTVHRVRLDGNRLIGNLIQTSGGETRPQYVYDFERRSWQPDTQRDVVSINP